MKDIIKNKKIVSIYLIWVFIHLFFYFNSRTINVMDSTTQKSYFWPFHNSNLFYYDVSELFVYCFLPIIIIYLYLAFFGKK